MKPERWPRISFVRITRSEVDLDPSVDPHSDEAYEKARENLNAFIAQQTLTQDHEPTFYLYGQVMGDHQLGILAALCRGI